VPATVSSRRVVGDGMYLSVTSCVVCLSEVHLRAQVVAEPRVPLADLPGQTGEDRIAARAAEADAHPAGQPLLSSTGDAPGAVDLSADRRRGFEQRFTGRRQSDPTGRPFEQIDVE